MSDMGGPAGFSMGGRRPHPSKLPLSGLALVVVELELVADLGLFGMAACWFEIAADFLSSP
jgi:hypothetical protein